MWKGVAVAYIVGALCYFPVSIVGYYIFGNNVDDNILITLEKTTWLVVIFAMPVFDMLEAFLVKKLHFTPTFFLRLVTRTFTMAVGICVPFFGYLLGFFEGLLSPQLYIFSPV
ncbi:hypothetical protein Pint_09776 [Pistacia integerrima]|uniref:Uncharacterized protein n=1 Tax=Pistacia integerrima TaxID=434235 RepID=A0ACC0XL60_9ROSI|nr:hypothetical protein Pint_09776 [Pistacia integerrima]